MGWYKRVKVILITMKGIVDKRKMMIEDYLKKILGFLIRILIGFIDIVNLECEQKKDLVKLLILIGSILTGFFVIWFNFVSITDKKPFLDSFVLFLYASIIYFIVIQKENSIDKQASFMKYYLYVIFIFILSYLVSFTFSLNFAALLTIALMDKSETLNSLVSHNIKYSSLFTFLIWAALMKKDKLTVILFYLALIILPLSLYSYLISHLSP